MKISFIIFLLLPLNLFGQLPPCDILKKASISYCNKDYTEALHELLEFRQQYNKHTLIGEVNQKIGHLYFLVSDFKKSKEESIALINGKRNGQRNSEYNAFECPTNYDSIGFNCMRIIFPEPYLHLQNLACIDLFEIYKVEKQFDLALEYLKLADKKYIYNTSCGNGNDQLDIEMALRYKEIYLLKSDTISAMRELSSVLFKYETGHKEVVKSLKSILDVKYTAEQKRFEINKTLNNIILKEEIINGKKYNTFEIIFLGNIVEFPSIIVQYEKIKTVDEMRNKLESLDFFINLGN